MENFDIDILRAKSIDDESLGSRRTATVFVLMFEWTWSWYTNVHRSDPKSFAEGRPEGIYSSSRTSTDRKRDHRTHRDNRSNGVNGVQLVSAAEAEAFVEDEALLWVRGDRRHRHSPLDQLPAMTHPRDNQHIQLIDIISSSDLFIVVFINVDDMSLKVFLQQLKCLRTVAHALVKWMCR